MVENHQKELQELKTEAQVLEELFVQLDKKRKPFYDRVYKLFCQLNSEQTIDGFLELCSSIGISEDEAQDIREYTSINKVLVEGGFPEGLPQPSFAKCFRPFIIDSSNEQDDRQEHQKGQEKIKQEHPQKQEKPNRGKDCKKNNKK